MARLAPRSIGAIGMCIEFFGPEFALTSKYVQQPEFQSFGNLTINQ